MTAEEWKKVEAKIKDNPDNVVRLKADGYNVVIISMIQKGKMSYNVYINNQMKVKWATEECEIRRKFYNKQISSMHNLAKSCKIPEEVREYFAAKNEKIETYTPFWTSFNRMKKHFIENNSSIEFIG